VLGCLVIALIRWFLATFESGHVFIKVDEIPVASLSVKVIVDDSLELQEVGTDISMRSSENKS
jgi:hypothetical protein